MGVRSDKDTTFGTLSKPVAIFSNHVSSLYIPHNASSSSRRQLPKGRQVRVCECYTMAYHDVLTSIVRWVPITSPDPTQCGMPQEFDASSEFAGKKIVLVSVPGAFTPGCQAFHVPPYIKNLSSILEKGVDSVVVIASNDGFVMNAWGKINGAKEDGKIKFMSDTKTFFSKGYGWEAGVGDRNGRWAMIIEKDGKISYAEVETSIREVKVRLEHRYRFHLQRSANTYCRYLAPKLYLRDCRLYGRSDRDDRYVAVVYADVAFTHLASSYKSVHFHC